MDTSSHSPEEGAKSLKWLLTTDPRVIEVLMAATFEEALHTLALQVRLAVGAHPGAIRYVPPGDVQAAIDTHAFSDKYEKYNSYDVMPTGQGIWGLVCARSTPCA